MASVDATAAYRWNFRLWVVETASWMVAIAFIDSSTVLPVLVINLTASPLLASLMVSLRYAGQGWPQLIAASLVSGKPYKKYYYLGVVTLGRLLLLWPALLLLHGVTQATLVVPAIMIAYFAFWISEGLSIVPWTEMVGKTIPPLKRGRLFAAMHVTGGVLGIGAGIGTRIILQRLQPFPVGYGMLFLLAFVGFIISTASLAILREPPSPAHEERYSTWALIRDIPNLLRAMPQFRLLVELQALFGFAVLPAPFYILYASTLLTRTIPGAVGVQSLGVGIFLAIQTAGMIFGNSLWGFLSDRYGNRLLLRALALAHVAVPLMAIIAGWVSETATAPLVIYLAFAPTFFAYGGLQGGTWMGVTNFLLELAPAHDRPAYIAVVNALNIPAIILPLIGGLLLSVVGYQIIFLIAVLVLCYAFYRTRRLQEQREMLLHQHRPPEKWE